jgi:hypothetical protein
MGAVVVVCVEEVVVVDEVVELRRQHWIYQIDSSLENLPA